MFKTIKSKVIFVVIFSIICITITTLLVLYRNIDIEEDESTNGLTVETSNEKDFPGIDLKGTYDQNDIKIEEKVVSKEKVEIRYCQIDGLRDKTIQDKINKELEQVALNFYQEKIKDLNEVVNVSVSMLNFANFANTISFNISYYAKKDDDSHDFYQDEIGLSYDLTTGKKITIDKLFTSDAPMENILRTSAYYSFIVNHIEIEENLNGDFIVSDYGDVEDEIAEFINFYKNGKVTEFYYTPMSINIYYDDNEIISVSMQKYAEYIAIYNRYLTSENIFEASNIGLKNLYTLSNRYTVDYRYTNYQKGNNYFIDISIDNIDGEKNKFSASLVQGKIKDVETEIEKVKSFASKNPDKFYILNYYMYIYTTDIFTTADHLIQQTLTNCYELGNSYDMTVHDFEENIESIIIEDNRAAGDGGELPTYVYNFENILKIAPQETMEYYNPETGEKIVI